MKYDIVCPLAEKDVDFFYRGIENLEKYVQPQGYVVIGNEAVEKRIKQKNNLKVRFENENQFISYEKVKLYIENRCGENSLATKRTGWYLQQFLKFSYALICDKEYYLLWDADTMPIKEHIMFEEGHPVFDMKTEHHEPYFKTFSKLFPNYEKRSSSSYISEHMIVKKEIMCELIEELKNAPVSGDTWHEKIINAIELSDLAASGFADYETYGLFCLNKYPELYRERTWDSLRPASNFFVYEDMTERDYDWLRKDYDAVSFEVGWRPNILVNLVCRNRIIQNNMSCKKILKKLRQFTI